MKKILLTAIAIATISTSAIANDKCSKGINSTAQTDDMIKAWAFTKSGDTVILINNIRNMKAIDISFYGWNKDNAKYFEKKYGCKNVSFRDAYSKFGLPLYKGY
tara:strand:+ start:226 stop:537 length:312 start_codon:yes stop_codon:yes gene_type:complete